jgi:hypothetical protein
MPPLLRKMKVSIAIACYDERDDRLDRGAVRIGKSVYLAASKI